MVRSGRLVDLLFSCGLMLSGFGAGWFGARWFGARWFGSAWFGVGGAEDALGDADQAVGSVPDLLEPVEDLLDTVLQAVGWIQSGFGTAGARAVCVRRQWGLGARGMRGTGRARRTVVLVVMAGGAVEAAG